MNNPQVVPPQAYTYRASTKTSNASFGVVDQMTKANVNISMWDVVASIPSQKKLLHHKLESIELRDQPPSMENAVSLVQPSKEV